MAGLVSLHRIRMKSARHRVRRPQLALIDIPFWLAVIGFIVLVCSAGRFG